MKADFYEKTPDEINSCATCIWYKKDRCYFGVRGTTKGGKPIETVKIPCWCPLGYYAGDDDPDDEDEQEQEEMVEYGEDYYLQQSEIDMEDYN